MTNGQKKRMSALDSCELVMGTTSFEEWVTLLEQLSPRLWEDSNTIDQLIERVGKLKVNRFENVVCSHHVINFYYPCMPQMK
jgi:hypothetical protein